MVQASLMTILSKAHDTLVNREVILARFIAFTLVAATAIVIA